MFCRGDTETIQVYVTPYGVAFYIAKTLSVLSSICTVRSIPFAELRFLKLHNIAHIFKNANKLKNMLL